MGEVAVLACLPGSSGWSVEDDLAELRELAHSAGATIAGVVTQRHGRTDPATLLTSGKVEELAAGVRRYGAQLVLVNRDLSPRQQLRLEEQVGCAVIDRTRLILDIFARRAQSREGRIQVELAQLLYLLPRLVGLGTELSRTGGGIGTRGPGETQLEADRRRVRRRIAHLRQQLAEIARHRRTQRRGRGGHLPHVVLVGYTNAGKSTLHRALTGSQVQVRDAPFVTLDPTTRLLQLPAQRQALLTDTVGFIHDLPPHLVAAFRATLEEVAGADLLLEVVDASHPRCLEHRAAVEAVLAELGALGVPRLVVWNKVDRLPPDPVRAPGPVPAQSGSPAAAVHVSALQGQGLQPLRDLIAQWLPSGRQEVHLHLRYEAQDLLAAVQREGEVLSLRYGEAGIDLVARCEPALAARLRAAVGAPSSGP